MLQGRGLRHVLAGLQDGKGVVMLVPAFKQSRDGLARPSNGRAPA